MTSRYALMALAVLVFVAGTPAATADGSALKPCPIPKSIQPTTEVDYCRAKGFTTAAGGPMVTAGCGLAGIRLKDPGGVFLHYYEAYGCNKAAGCQAQACDAIYKVSGMRREAE